MKTINLSAFLLLAALLIQFSSCDLFEDCPYCTEALRQDPVVPETTPFLRIPMKWCALNESPFIVEPSCRIGVGPEVVLYGRTDRAISCIWGPQCKITHIPGSETRDGYAYFFDDPDLSVGEPGDVAIDYVDRNASLTDEIIDLAIRCDQAWGGAENPRGILALAIRRFVSPTGVPSTVRGVGYSPLSATRAFLIVVDNEFSAQNDNNEQLLAHEMGHVMGLCHTNEACNVAEDVALNLMTPTGAVALSELDINQCNLARNRFPIIFAPSGAPGLHASFAMDEGGESILYPTNKALDLYKVFVADNTANDKELKIFLGTNGLQAGYPASYWIAFDLDNNAGTGLSLRQFIGQSNQGGVDLAIELPINQHGDILETRLYQAQGDQFSKVDSTEQFLTAKLKTIDMFATTDEGCFTSPAFTEVEITVGEEGLAFFSDTIGAGPFFRSGVGIQAISQGVDAEGQRIFDFCPNTMEVLRFPATPSPQGEIKGSGKPCPGETVTVNATGLLPNQPIQLIFNYEKVDIDAKTNEKGEVSFGFEIPQNTDAGTQLLRIKSGGSTGMRIADVVLGVCSR